MKRHDKRQTVQTFVQRVAREHGYEVDRIEAMTIAWEYTGYPAFWTGDPMECFDRQLTEFFAGPLGDSE